MGLGILLVVGVVLFMSAIGCLMLFMLFAPPIIAFLQRMKDRKNGM